MSYFKLKNDDDDDDENICPHLQVNNSSDTYCDKYNKSLGNFNNGAVKMKVTMHCFSCERPNNCFLDMEIKAKEAKETKAREEQENFNREIRGLIEIDTKKIQENPDNDELYVSRAGSYGMLKENDKAIADYNEAIRINPKNADAYALRGGLYNTMEKRDKGIIDLNEAIRIDPNCQRAYSLRGCYYHDKKEFDKSIADLEKALELNSDDNISFTVLGWARKLKEEAEEKAEKERKEAKEKRIEVEKKAKEELRKTEIANYRKANKTKFNIGITLHICLTFTYIFALWGTDIIRVQFFAEEAGWIISCVPLFSFSLLIGLVSIAFLRKSDYHSGIFILILVVLLQSITTPVWAGKIGILALHFLLNVVVAIIINTISALAGCIMVYSSEPYQETKSEKQ